MISNSSPLIFLSKINKLHLLKNLFGKVIITGHVKEEVLKSDKEGYDLIKKSLEEGWLIVKDPKKNIELGLGKGENSVINLAKELEDSLIIDDNISVKACKAFEIETFRVTSVILMSFKKNLLTKKETKDCINEIISEGYYISPRYYTELMKKIG